MNKKIPAIALTIALLPSYAFAVKDMPDAETLAILSAWKQRCTDFAAGEGQPALKKACMDGVFAGMKEVAQLGRDDSVSEQMWDVCKAESGFNYTNDFHAWAACMRIARTRPGLRDH